jgi:hypothetical protein
MIKVLTTVAGWFGLGWIKFALYGVGVLALVGTILGTYYSWKHGVETRALADWNKQQVEEVLKNQAENAAKLAEIAQYAEQLKAEQARDLEALEAKTKSILDWLDTPEAKKKDRGASDVLKRTMDELRKMK